MEMNVANLMDKIMSMNPSGLLSKGSTATTAALAVTIAVSVLICLLGLKLIRVINVLAGLITGGAAGFILCWIFGWNDMTAVAVTGGAALVLAVLSGIFKRFGVFIYCLVTVFMIAAGLIRPQNWVLVAVCGAIGLIAAIVTMLVFDPFVIIVTSISGGAGAGSGVASIIGIGNLYLTLGISAVVALIGIGVQFAVRYREVARKEVRHAKAVKEEISKEQEVEQLRNLLDDEEDE